VNEVIAFSPNRKLETLRSIPTFFEAAFSAGGFGMPSANHAFVLHALVNLVASTASSLRIGATAGKVQLGNGNFRSIHTSSFRTITVQADVFGDLNDRGMGSESSGRRRGLPFVAAIWPSPAIVLSVGSSHGLNFNPWVMFLAWLVL
jgi:hypothetical protein